MTKTATEQKKIQTQYSQIFMLIHKSKFYLSAMCSVRNISRSGFYH